jgi:hypothetical protein
MHVGIFLPDAISVKLLLSNMFIKTFDKYASKHHKDN